MKLNITLENMNKFCYYTPAQQAALDCKTRCHPVLQRFMWGVSANQG